MLAPTLKNLPKTCQLKNRVNLLSKSCRKTSNRICVGVLRKRRNDKFTVLAGKEDKQNLPAEDDQREKKEVDEYKEATENKNIALEVEDLVVKELDSRSPPDSVAAEVLFKLAQDYEEGSATSKVLLYLSRGIDRDQKARSKAAIVLGSQAQKVRTAWEDVLSKVDETKASADDIGWTMDESDEDCIDVTTQFEALLARAQGGEVLLTSSASQDNYIYLFVAGLFNEFYPGYLREAVDHFNAQGRMAVLSGARGDSPVRENAVRILAEVETLTELQQGVQAEGDQQGPMQVVLVGHSKGGIDSCAACALYEDRLQGKVRGIVCVQSPYGGSAIATDLLASSALASRIPGILEALLQLEKGSGEALIPPIRDLCYKERREFLAAHPLPPQFPCLCFHSSTAAPSSLLFAPAAYFRSRYQTASDGLVAVCDAEVPGSRVVRFESEFDHLDAVFPPTWDQSLLSEEKLPAAQTPPPLAGQLIVQSSTILRKTFKKRVASAPTSSELHEALVALLLAEDVF